MHRLPFVQVDVFTAKPLEGNQLAVFPDARGLTSEQMQAIAREMNFCETTFVIPKGENPPAGLGSAVKVRIFTVAEELPFAGHPTLGTAAVLRGTSGADVICLDLKMGKIPVRFETADEAGAVFGEMQQRDPDFGSIHSREEVARCLGLALDDIRDDLPIQTVSTGLPFVIVPLRSLKVIQGLHINFHEGSQYLEHTDGKFFYFVSQQTVDSKARLHARMIFYNGEDPATGSAAGACGAWMVKYGVAQPGERVWIEQGLEMKRPSQIFVRGEREGDRVINIRVGGNTVEVARGELNF